MPKPLHGAGGAIFPAAVKFVRCSKLVLSSRILDVLAIGLNSRVIFRYFFQQSSTSVLVAKGKN